MREIDGVKHYRISEVCEKVGRSQSTIIRVWYGAAEYAAANNIHFPFFLPAYRTDQDKKGTRYWSEEAVAKLIKFRDSIRPGDLAFYNRTHMWGGNYKITKERQEFRKELSELAGEPLEELMDKLD